MRHILFTCYNKLSAIKKFTPLFQLLLMQIMTGVGAGIQRNSLICNDTSHHSAAAAKMLALTDIKATTTTTVKPFTEYYLEHEVTEKEARQMFAELMARDKDFDRKKPLPYCDKCTEQIHKYCLGPIFLKDHCCCDFRHEADTLPFIPHSCYVGEDQGRPSSIVKNSCVTYSEIRECCCDQILKKTYKSIYSNSPTINQNLLPPLIVMFFYKLAHVLI